MHVNQSYSGQVVFKTAAFRFKASVKTSSPLLDCRVSHSHSLVKFVPCRHNANYAQLANVFDSMLVHLFCLTDQSV